MKDEPSAGVTGLENGAPGTQNEFDRFDDYFKADYRSLISFLIFIGASLEQAKDAAQEAMSQVAARWAAIANPKSYARCVARRAYYRMNEDDQRARSPQRGRTQIELDGDLAVNTAVFADFVKTITELDAIQTAIQRLSPVQRETVAMYLSGFSPQETAEVLKSKPATVRSNLRHGLRELKKLLEIPEGASETGWPS